MKPHQGPKMKSFFESFSKEEIEEAVTKLLKQPEIKGFLEKVIILAQAAKDDPSLLHKGYLNAVFEFANRRLIELGIERDIWRELTPQPGFELKFEVSPKATQVLGNRTQPTHDNWTAWEAAELAAAANAALLPQEQYFASALGHHIGTLIKVEQREMIQSAIKSQLKANGKVGGRNKKGYRSPFKELIFQICKRMEKPQPYEVIQKLESTEKDGDFIASLCEDLPIRNIEIVRTKKKIKEISYEKTSTDGKHLKRVRVRLKTFKAYVSIMNKEI